MKLRFLVIALVLISALLVVGCGSTPAATTAAPASTGDAAAGKTLYANSCTSCHGPDAKGIAGLGKDLTASEFVKSTSDSDLVAFVMKGRPASDPANTTKVDMPPKGGNPALTEADITNIVAYIRTLNH